MWILLVSTCTCMRSVGLLQRTLRSARENGARFITKDFTFIFRHIQDLIHRLWVAHPVFVTDQLKGERAGYRTCPLFCPATAPDEHPGKDERDVLPKKVRPRKHLIWKLVSGRYHTHARRIMPDFRLPIASPLPHAPSNSLDTRWQYGPTCS